MNTYCFNQFVIQPMGRWKVKLTEIPSDNNQADAVTHVDTTADPDTKYLVDTKPRSNSEPMNTYTLGNPMVKEDMHILYIIYRRLY